MLVLYDDVESAPAVIRQAIGVQRFGSVLRRKRRLADVLRSAVEASGGLRFEHVVDAGRRAALVEAAAREPGARFLLRLPSCLVSRQSERFATLLQKLPYSKDMAIFGDPFDDEAAALMDFRQARAYFECPDAAARRAHWTAFRERAIRVDDVLSMVDLRDLPAFLDYMKDATETRHFNSAQVQAGVFRKSSADKAKMRGEYAYFTAVPEALRRFLLPTFDFREDESGASYAMENLAVPDAALQLVHRSFDIDSFGRLLDRFFSFIAAREERQVGTAAVRDRARVDILGKMDRRLDQFLDTVPGRRLDAILAACGPHGDLGGLRARARAAIEQAIRADETATLATGHGDACLSNILFSRDLGIFRLIDPKGATSLEQTFMHPLYDLSKFSHSILGGYDFINNGLFEIRLDESLHLQLELDGDGPPAWMRTAFSERLRRHGFNLRTIRAYELSLFLSMLPLHADVERKLPAFCMVASSILSELEI